jgi:D-serine deaminase-like pyridoxal phosphate-dependent protein
MKRRTAILGGLAATVTGAVVVRPSERGGPHDPYFKALNEALRSGGPGRPVIVLDRDRLRSNIEKVRAKLSAKQAFRVVAKSLPSLPLLREVMERLGTNRLMTFHEPHLRAVAAGMPDADQLLGKPMPVNAAAAFYASGAAGEHVQWLIDSDARLAQYQQLAKERSVKLRINVEIDVGLHRGGLRAPAELEPLVARAKADPEHLELTGLMGYDAHVGGIPSVIESAQTSFDKACDAYAGFKAKLLELEPQLKDTGIFNGGGSRTLRMHADVRSPLNEVAAGSCFVKPKEFDVALLDDLEPAAFIATPVLKVLEGTTLPGLNRSNALWPLWDRNRAQTFFIYGGQFPGEYVSPPGLIDNPLYGKSSNQAMVNGSSRVELKVDDWVFLWPTQSEKVLLDYGDLAVVEGGKLSAFWPVLPA